MYNNYSGMTAAELLRSRGININPPVEETFTLQKNSSILGDVVDAAQMGGYDALGGIANFFGADDLAATLSDKSSSQIDTMTDEGREGMQKEIYSSESGFNADAATDIDYWLLNIANLAGQMAATAPLGGVGGKAVSALGKMSAVGRKAGAVMSKLPVGMGKSSTIGVGVSGGAAASGMAGVQAAGIVDGIPLDELFNSDKYRDILRQVNEQNPDLSDSDKFDLAKKNLVAQVNSEVTYDPALLLTNFAGSFLGDNVIAGAFKNRIKSVLGKEFTGGASKAAGMVKGFTAESMSEAAQGSMEAYTTNKALTPIDGREVMEGVFAQGVNEGILGGMAGGLMGSVAPNKKQVDNNGDQSESNNEPTDNLDSVLDTQQSESLFNPQAKPVMPSYSLMGASPIDSILSGEQNPAQQVIDNETFAFNGDVETPIQQVVSNDTFEYNPEISVTPNQETTNSSVVVTKSGKPFKSEKSMQISKDYKDAVAAGLNVETVEVDGGYGWQVAQNVEPTQEIEQPVTQEVAQSDIIEADRQPDQVEQNEFQGLPIQETPLNELTLSEDVPQFKDGANDDGVVDALGGSFDRTGVAPIQVWVREDGRKEVISGRHRLDLARRSGEETIPTQYHYESDGFDAVKAASLDAILNVRDGQGKVKDYVKYLQANQFTQEEADAEGILGRATGKRAFTIANSGSEDLIAAHSADLITDEAATRLAEVAPNEAKYQALGLKAIQEGKSIANAENLVRAVKSMTGEQMGSESGDLFGFDDSAMVEAEKLAKAASAKQRELKTRLSAIRGAAKNPKVAKAEGVDVKDPNSLNKRITELTDQAKAWDSWHTNPSLANELREAVRIASSNDQTTVKQREDLTLTQESEQQRNQRETKQEQVQQAQANEVKAQEQKSQADNDLDDFRLSGSNQEADKATSYGQNDMFGAVQDEKQIEAQADLSTETVDKSVDNTDAVQEPDILRLTKNAWVKQKLLKDKVKKSSPGYADAKTKVEEQYDTELDKASANVSFERYNELNSDTPERINRKAYDAIREDLGISEGQSVAPTTEQQEPTETLTTKGTRLADKAAEKLFGNEGDNGNIILFNKSKQPITTRGVTEKSAKLDFKRFTQKFKGLNDEGFDQIITDKKPSEIFGPSVAADDNYIKGAFDKSTNRVFIFTQNHKSIDDIRRTLREELLTHKGLGVFEGKEISELLDRINATRNSSNKAIQDIWADIEKNYGDQPAIIQAEEFLGKVAQDEITVPDKYWHKIVATLQKLMRKFGLVKESITMPEMRTVVADISDKLQAGQEARNYQFDSQAVKDNIRFNRDTDNDTLNDAKAKLGLGDEVPVSIVDKVKQTIEGFNFKIAKERAKEGIFDSLYGIKKAEEAAGIDKEDQGYVSARLAGGVGDVVHGVMFYGAPEWKDGIIQRKENTTGMLEVFGQLDRDQLNDWLGWMGGNRGSKLMEEGRENNLTQEDIDQLLTLNKGQEALFDKVKVEYNQLNSAVLDLAEVAGLVAPEVRTKFDSEWYVPFFRQEETEDIGEVISGGFNASGIANQTGNLQKLKGGKMATNDILVNILQRQATLIEASMKNKAMVEVAENLEGTGMMEPVKLNKFEAEKVSRKRSQNKATPYVSVTRDGEKQWYKVAEPALLRGLTQLNVTRSDNPLIKMARGAKRFLTTGVTLSPEFILRNFMRDSVHGWMINKDGFTLGLDSVKGAIHTWKEDKSTLDIMFSGASFQGGYVHATDPEAAAQQIRRGLRKKGLDEGQISKYMASIPKNIGKMLEKYREISDGMENANRVSTYTAALDAKKTKKVAAYEARDFMDFGLQGNFKTMQFLVDVIPFLNARLQGMYKLYRAGKANEDHSLAKGLSKELATKGMWVAGFSLALALVNEDDERYEELKDWDKDANWHFFFGDDHVRIPKPFELGIIFGTIPERLLMRGMGKQNNDDLTRSATHAIVGTMAFNPLPQIIKPATEAFMNYDTFGMRPIDGFGDMRKQPEDRFSRYTTETAKALGKTLGVSPNKIEHLVRGYAGTLGSYVLVASDMVANMGEISTGTGEFKYNEIDDLSVVRAFYKSGEVGSTYYSERFYETLKEANAIHGQFKAAKEDRDMERAKEILAEDKVDLRFRSMFNKSQARMNKFNQQASFIWKNQRLSLKEREAKIDEITKRKNALARQIVLQYRAFSD